MHVFVTGATGYVGSAVVAELVGASHEVTGLARSDRAAESLLAAGAKAHRGTLDDLDSLRAGAAGADGVVHLAFRNVSPTTDYAAASASDARAITALGEALVRSGRPLVVTSGTALVGVVGRAATEDDPATWGPRVVGEQAALALTERGVRISIVRLASCVHDGEGDRHGFVPGLIATARRTGVSAYVGDGANRWTGVHRLDAARLFRLAMEEPTGGIYHAVGDEGIPLRQVAEAIGARPGLSVVSLPAEESSSHFGYLAPFVTLDDWSTSEQTRARLDWQPTHLGLLADIEHGGYLR